MDHEKLTSKKGKVKCTRWSVRTARALHAIDVSSQKQSYQRRFKEYFIRFCAFCLASDENPASEENCKITDFPL